MWIFWCKFVRVVGVTLIPGLISQGRASGATPPQFQDLRDFHHTAWNGLGAVFEGYLWLTRLQHASPFKISHLASSVGSGTVV
jgi:hypothetical protein